MAKTCTKCSVVKDETEFYTDKRTGNTRAWCKECARAICSASRKARGTTDTERNTRFIKVYGISLEDYNLMLEAQDNRCYICGKTEEENKKKLAIDHCHNTGRVRKLLCHHCNCALGMVNDDPEILISMLSYLKETE